jgi:hypothetical protein
MKVLTLALAAAVGSVPVQAESPSVDPAISFVTTGGYWKRDGQDGAYRIVVRQSGYEHVSSQVTVQWVARPTSENAQGTILRSLELVAGGFFSFGEPRLTRLSDGVRVSLIGVDTHQPGRKVGCIFELNSAGRKRTIKSCG